MNKFIAVYTAFSLLAILIADEATKPSWDKADQPSAAMAFNSNNEWSSNDVEEIEENLESELELKRMINFVTPLMAIFQRQKTKLGATRQTRSAEVNPDEFNNEDFNSPLMKMVEEGRKRGSGRRPMYKSSSQPIQPDRSGYGYGDYSSGSSYGGGGGGGSYGCCDKKDVRVIGL